MQDANDQKKQTNQENPTGWFSRFLATVEWLGNLLPHPITLFALLATAIVIISGVLGYFDVSVVDPRPLSQSLFELLPQGNSDDK